MCWQVMIRRSGHGRSVGRQPDTYLAFEPGRHEGKRIGILESFFGDEPINEPVNAVMKQRFLALRKVAQQLVPIKEVVDSAYLTSDVSVT